MGRSVSVDCSRCFECRSLRLSTCFASWRSLDRILSCWRFLLRESSSERPRKLSFEIERSLLLPRELDSSLVLPRAFDLSRSLDWLTAFRRVRERPSNCFDLSDLERFLDPERFLGFRSLCSSLLNDRERFLDRESIICPFEQERFLDRDPFIRSFERSTDLKRSLLREPS